MQDKKSKNLIKSASNSCKKSNTCHKAKCAGGKRGPSTGPKRTVPKRDSEWVRKEPFRNLIQNGSESNRSENSPSHTEPFRKIDMINIKLEPCATL
jgi:hypothetical protein